MPISATVIPATSAAVISRHSGKLGTFGHGYTYAGHPVAAAVALETLRIYKERDIVAKVKAVAPHFQSRLRAFASHPLVGEARGVGLIGAVHLVADKATRRPLPPAEGIGPLVQQAAMARGVIVRAGPDAAFVCPPLIITEAEINELMDALGGALDEAHAAAQQRGLLGQKSAA